MAKRPPSSGTSGRSSGGMTGMTSRIIHSGRLLDLRKESTTFRRLAYFTFFLRRLLGAHLVAELDGELLDVDALEQLLDRLGAHLRLEPVLVLLARLAVLLLVQQLVLLELGLLGIDDDVGPRNRARSRSRRRCRADDQSGSGAP